MTITDAHRGLRAIRAGLAGNPISHSLSPRLFALAAAQSGIECSYDLLQCLPQDFSAVVNDCRRQGYSGLSVTTPHKRSAWELATSHSEDARLTGNANLLLLSPEGIHAANTDVAGFSEALLDHAEFDARGTRALVLGTGSVAASVVLALARLGCREINVAGRRQSLEAFRDRAEACAGACTLHLLDLESNALTERVADSELVVNCTSAGMAGREDESPLSGVFVCHRDLLALDLVYHPRVTRFMSQLRNCGAHSVNGLAMLACQAAAAFELLSGAGVDSRELLSGLGEA